MWILDQVIKADLKELWDMDLQGAPYGYTPFCEGDIKIQLPLDSGSGIKVFGGITFKEDLTTSAHCTL